jgi:hypothetical protein
VFDSSEQIGPTSATLRDGDTTGIIPNARLIDEIVKR